jgi:hypothetical protein
MLIAVYKVEKVITDKSGRSGGGFKDPYWDKPTPNWDPVRYPGRGWGRVNRLTER